MLTFLFWNLAGQRLIRPLSRLVARHQVDILMLAECPFQPADFLPELNQDNKSTFQYSPDRVWNKIEIYTRFPGNHLEPFREGQRYTIRRLRLEGRQEILLAVVHLPDKSQWKDASQWFEAAQLSTQIREAEKDAGHQRTLLVGDMNMNPFEEGMIAAAGLHAVMTRQTALKEERTVLGQTYPYFYNPMWGHFGDATGTPAGTYYNARSEHVCYFWNMFDQVLLRPELLSAFRNEELQILTTDGERSFLTRSGSPRKSTKEHFHSDHLPIVFRLHLRGTQHD